MADNSNIQPNQAPNAVPVYTLKEIHTIEEAAEFLSVSKAISTSRLAHRRFPITSRPANDVTLSEANLRYGFSPEEFRQNLKSRNGRMHIVSKLESDVRRDDLLQC